MAVVGRKVRTRARSWRLLLTTWSVLAGACAGTAPPTPTVAAPAVAARPLQWGDPPPAAAAGPTARSAADPAAATPSAALAAAAAEAGYRLGPEDAVEIAVWRDETLRGTFIVRPDGAVTFPLVGEVSVAGRTAAEVREELTRRLERYLPEPVVTVNVARVASYRIYVLGRVNRPGDFAVGRHIDVLQALALAGGLTPFADEDGIRIIRRVQGRSVWLPFQYSRVRRAGDLSQNVVLQSGDVLVVP